MAVRKPTFLASWGGVHSSRGPTISKITYMSGGKWEKNTAREGAREPGGSLLDRMGRESHSEKLTLEQRPE